jgi:hypothetical protein
MKKNMICIVWVFTTILCISYFGCVGQNNSKKIKELLKKDKAIYLVEAFYLIGENKDTSFIKQIFDNPYDERISHHINFNGISVYEAKMSALKKISGLNPPQKITNDPDPAIINFYRNWAIENGYLSK